MRAKVQELSRASDPKAGILKEIGDIADVGLFHNLVLVATYIRPEKTAGGIYMPQKTQDEDKWQGKVGLVLKKGPMAFKDDGVVKFYGQDAKVGAWVWYRASDGFELLIRGVHCRILEDVSIKGTLPVPEYIW